MVKITIVYPRTSGVRFDMEYYLEKHMPVSIECLSGHPGFRGVSVERGIAGAEPGSDPAAGPRAAEGEGGRAGVGRRPRPGLRDETARAAGADRAADVLVAHDLACWMRRRGRNGPAG